MLFLCVENEVLLKQGVRYVTLTLNKDGLCFSVEPQNKESNTYLGFAMIVKAGRAYLVTADTAQDELTQLG